MNEHISQHDVTSLTIIVHMRKVKFSEDGWRNDVPASEKFTMESEYCLPVIQRSKFYRHEEWAAELVVTQWTESGGRSSPEKGRSGAKVDVDGSLSSMGSPGRLSEIWGMASLGRDSKRLCTILCCLSWSHLRCKSSLLSCIQSVSLYTLPIHVWFHYCLCLSPTVTACSSVFG